MSTAETVPEKAEVPSGTGRLTTPAVIAALVALGALAAFTIYMITEADTGSEVTWSRLAWLFSSVEAIAFAAAGALFGARVHRERAEKAEAEARKSAGDAARGKALAAALKADDAVAAESPATRGLGDDDEDMSLRSRHARLAQELFPD